MLKKKTTTCLLLIAIIMLMVAGCGQEEEKNEFIGITSERIENKGGSTEKALAFRNVSMYIDSLDVYEDVDISGAIHIADEAVQFHFTGDLYVSEKQNHGIEAYVGQIADCENNFEVNYFEIKNDTSYDLFKYSEENLNKRVISFDLERNGINYYFELDMDELGVSFHADSITKPAPSEIDFYANYVNEEKSVASCIISSDSEEHPRARSKDTHSYSVTGDCWYYKLVVDGWYGDETVYEYYAEPRMEGEIADVWTASSWMWTSKLVFDGYVAKNGVCIDTVDNVFSIQAGMDESDGIVSNGIEFQIHTGENTIVTSGKFEGVCKVNGEESDDQPQLKSTFVSDYSGENNYAVYKQFDDSLSLDKTTHCLTFSGFVSTIDSAKAANQATDCVVCWSYNICYGDHILDSQTLQKTINYTVNMK